jgi:hypothetical protein
VPNNVSILKISFNTFNHPQSASFGASAVNARCNSLTPPGDPCGGSEITLRNGQVNAAWPARIMQFGLKFLVYGPKDARLPS